MRQKAKPQEFATHFKTDRLSLDKITPKRAQLCCSRAASCAAGGTVPSGGMAEACCGKTGTMPKTESFKFLQFPSLSFTSLLLLNCHQFGERTADMPFFFSLLVIIGFSYLPAAIHAAVGGVSKISWLLSSTLVIIQKLIMYLNRLGLFIL